MQLSAFLDVAITLVSAYVLVSLLCTTLNEIITTLLKTRAKTLKRTVTALLDDPYLQKAFLDNAVIKSMFASSGGGKGVVFPSYLDGRTFAEALIHSLPDLSQPGADLAKLEDRVQAIPAGNIKGVLSVLLASAGTDAAAFKDGIAVWFDSAMDRLSGEYVRLMKYVSFGVGCLLALALNVDTVNLAMVSWNDRQTAEIVSAALPEDGSSLLAACPIEDPKALNCQLEVVSKIGVGLRSFPIGWGDGAIPKTSNDWLSWWLLKLLGLICTGFAVSLGAPFWFDVLQSVMSLRGTGVKRDENPAPVK